MHLITIAAAAFAINFAPALGYVYSTQSLCTTLLGSNSVSPVKTSSYVLTIPITFTKKATVTPTSTITPSPVTSTSTVTTVVRDRQRLPRLKETGHGYLTDMQIHQTTSTVLTTPTSTVTETDTETDTVSHPIYLKLHHRNGVLTVLDSQQLQAQYPALKPTLRRLPPPQLQSPSQPPLALPHWPPRAPIRPRNAQRAMPKLQSLRSVAEPSKDEHHPSTVLSNVLQSAVLANFRPLVTLPLWSAVLWSSK